MNNILSKLKTNFPIIIILAVCTGVALTNYSRGTFLTGWDNLHPEFNFPMNVYRSLFAVWQEYQGLGLLGGMAHASDLPRQLFLWASSLLIPQSLLRYFYHFLMLPIGMLGVYVFLKDILLLYVPQRTRKIAATLGSLFYLLNLGTIQYFYVPFEPYSTFWGFFPWEIATLFRFLRDKTKKNFLFFVLANALAIPQAYVQTIFLVYLLCVGVVVGINALQEKTAHALKIAGLIFGTIIAINAFWLLPNLYFVTTNLHITKEAMQNHMATEKFFQMNKARGTLLDVPLLKEFYFDFFDFNKESGTFDYMMKPWREHFASFFVQLAGYTLFLIAVFGIFVNKQHPKVFFSLFALCLFVFLSSVPGIDLLNNLLRLVPPINQIFRNPFTKFIVPLVFLYAIGLGSAIAYTIERMKARYYAFVLFILPISFFLGFTTFPIFGGNFISPTMRVTIPKEYFYLFDYFQTQDKNARIMNLPQGSFWGWYYYRFGIRGSGFLWYGIEQPILDRAFDVWSRENENYYWELSYALQKQDKHLFNAILEKYQVGFVLFDENILFADNINSVRYAMNQETLVRKNDKLKLAARFGKLSVYKVSLVNQPTRFVLGSTTLPATIEKTTSVSKDQVFQSLNMYQNQKDTNADLFYPFESLFTNRTVKERPFTIQTFDQKTQVSTLLPEGRYRLTLPAFTSSATLLPVEVQAKLDGTLLSVKLTLLQPTVSVGGKEFTKPERSQEIAFLVPRTSQAFYLSINNNDFFFLNDLTPYYQVVGSSYLENSDEVNYLRLYQATPTKEERLLPNGFGEGKICGQKLSSSSVATKASNGLLSLEARDTANCTVFKTPLEGYENSLLRVRFTYTSSTDEFPQFCYYSQTHRGCLNKKDVIKTGFARENGFFEDLFEGYQGESDQGFFHLILEAQSDEDKNQTKHISYSTIQISAYPYIGGMSIPLTQLKDSQTTTELTLPHQATIQVHIPTPDAYASYTHPIRNNLYKTTALNYDKVLPGKYSLEELETDPKRVRTTASQASSYLLLRAQNITAGNGYLVRLDSYHKQGFPFTVNIFTNQEFRNFVYTYASAEKGFHTDYFILPPLYPFDKGVSVLLGSTSYNATPTVNDLVDVTITPLPYDFLTTIKLQRKDAKRGIATRTKVEVTKKAISSYIVTPKDETRFLILSQGYHPGWQAYMITKGKSEIANRVKQSLPFLFGKRLIHRKVNSWENGWELPEEKMPTEGRFGTADQLRNKRVIVITYLPQMLETLGFLFTPLPFFLLGIAHLKRKRTNKPKLDPDLAS